MSAMEKIDAVTDWAQEHPRMAKAFIAATLYGAGFVHGYNKNEAPAQPAPQAEEVQTVTCPEPQTETSGPRGLGAITNQIRAVDPDHPVVAP